LKNKIITVIQAPPQILGSITQITTWKKKIKSTTGNYDNVKLIAKVYTVHYIFTIQEWS
jgi:hypothetical protein